MREARVLGSSLIFPVVPPIDPQPFLGIGTGWDEPRRPQDATVIRRIRNRGELLIYSASPRSIVVSAVVTAAGSGILRMYSDDQQQATVTLQPGEQQIRVSLAATQGVTRLVLVPEAADDVVVGEVDLQVVN